jgi:predicted dehydrogenase
MEPFKRVIAMIPRRTFLKTTSLAAATLAAPRAFSADSPGRKLIVGVVGLGRGHDHVNALLQIPDVEIGYVCDVSEDRRARGAKTVSAKQERAPQAVTDFRRILEDKTIDAIFIATPNHWHAPAAILACSAGKHVYVEKPGSHNAREGEWLVAAARKNNRVVQMGNQRRSWPALIEGMDKLRGGVIGRVFSARTWYNNARASIGRGHPAPVPATLDYSLWQGPAPERPYVSNLIPYNWHWRWHWGGGELANNGIHALDVARWGLGVEYPHRVTFGGGRYHFDDDQETPDTGMATFDFGEKAAFWDGSSCAPRGGEKLSFVTFYGEGGSLEVRAIEVRGQENRAEGYRILDPKGKLISEQSGSGGELGHIKNFLDSVRGLAKPNSEIGEGQKSTLLCHLGNIAYRTGHTLNIDPKTGRIVGDADAEKLWSREYRPGWEPRV